jgi:hypothetical protein
MLRIEVQGHDTFTGSRDAASQVEGVQLTAEEYALLAPLVHQAQTNPDTYLLVHLRGKYYQLVAVKE